MFTLVKYWTERESWDKLFSENLRVEIILNLVNGHGMRLKQVAPEKKLKDHQK